MVGGDFFSGRVTDFSSGVAAVSAEGEFAGEEIVRAGEDTLHVVVSQREVEVLGGDGGIAVEMIHHPADAPPAFVLDPRHGLTGRDSPDGPCARCLIGLRDEENAALLGETELPCILCKHGQHVPPPGTIATSQLIQTQDDGGLESGYADMLC